MAKTLSTQSIIDKEKVPKGALKKLKRIVENYETLEEEFDDLEEVNMEVIKEGSFSFLKIDFLADNLDDFPTVETISKFVKKLFAKAGIK